MEGGSGGDDDWDFVCNVFWPLHFTGESGKVRGRESLSAVPLTTQYKDFLKAT